MAVEIAGDFSNTGLARRPVHLNKPVGTGWEA